MSYHILPKALVCSTKPLKKESKICLTGIKQLELKTSLNICEFNNKKEGK